MAPLFLYILYLRIGYIAQLYDDAQPIKKEQTTFNGNAK